MQTDRGDQRLPALGFLRNVCVALAWVGAAVAPMAGLPTLVVAARSKGPVLEDVMAFGYFGLCLFLGLVVWVLFKAIAEVLDWMLTVERHLAQIRSKIESVAPEPAP